MVTLKKSANGRHVLISDGCNIDGALVQGSTICRISFPPSVRFEVNPCDALSAVYGGCRMWWRDVASLASVGEIPGAIVYAFREVA